MQSDREGGKGFALGTKLLLVLFAGTVSSTLLGYYLLGAAAVPTLLWMAVLVGCLLYLALYRQVTRRLTRITDSLELACHKGGEVVQLQDGSVDVIGRLSRALLRYRTGTTAEIEACRAQIQELERLQSMSQATNAAKLVFLSHLSHQVRTPMTAVMGYAEMLRELHQDPEVRRPAETIVENSQHLVAVVDYILEFARLDIGQTMLHCEQFAPLKLVEQVLSMLRSRARFQGVTVELEHVGALPETIESDPDRVRQVLVGLVGLAVTHARTPRVSLTLSMMQLAEDAEPRLGFLLRNTGIRLCASEFDEAFAAYAAADPRRTRQESSVPLELSVLRQFAQLLGGELEIRDTTELGAELLFSVPTGDLQGVSFSPIREEDPAVARSQQAQCLAGRRVLIAEDREDSIDVLRHLLRGAGAEVEVARDGLRAYQEVHAAEEQFRPFDVLLVDLQMPVWDGATLTAKLRAEGYARSIIALTSLNDPRSRRQSQEAGCDEFLAKPLRGNELLAAVLSCST